MTSTNDGRSVKGGSSGQSASSSHETPMTVKLILLVVLCLQNAVYTMLRRYSVGVLEEKWTTSSVLLVGEVIKLVVSVFMTLVDKSSSSAEGRGLRKLWWLVRASPPMFIPAFVYWMMNLLSYVSIKRVDASTFTVCAQMKILTTAVFSVILMGRSFHSRKWRALFLLVLGVVLVSNGSLPATDEGDETMRFDVQYVIGVAAVITEVTLSGFVSVFFEKVLKSRVVNLSVWDRNFQLAMYSILGYCISGNLPTSDSQEGGMFDGWTLNAVILAILGSAGGLLVAFTTKYTDAVLKTFATSGAIIVTAVAGHVLLSSPLDVPIGIGAGCTVLSLLNYSDEGDPQSPTRANGASSAGGGAEQGTRTTPQTSARRGKDGHSDYEYAQPLIAPPPASSREAVV